MARAEPSERDPEWQVLDIIAAAIEGSVEAEGVKLLIDSGNLAIKVKHALDATGFDVVRRAEPTRLACPICGGDVCEHRIEAWEGRSALLGAIYDVIWHYRPVTISIRGTHVNWTELATGDFTFNIDNQDHQDAFVGWARALRSREANAPLPEPPEEYRNG